MREVVDGVWSPIFGVEADVLRSPGVRVVADAPGLHGYQGLWALRLGDGCTISAPQDRVAAVRERVAGRSADDVFTRELLRDIAGEHAGVVVGPSIHAYVNPTSFVAPPPCDAERIDGDPDPILEPLRIAVQPDDWAEAFGPPFHGDAWVLREGGLPVAAGNMTDNFGRGRDDVGLVTHPAHRGRGLGSQIAGAMVADALPRLGVVRYRALATNLASRAVCRKLGFVDDGANIAVRPIAART